jgi:hypothetical protein
MFSLCKLWVQMVVEETSGEGGLAVTRELTSRSIAVSMSPSCTCVTTHLCQNTYRLRTFYTLPTCTVHSNSYTDALTSVSFAITLSHVFVCLYTSRYRRANGHAIGDRGKVYIHL